MDATVHSSKAQEYQIRGYPTIKFFPSGTSNPSGAEEYTGGRTSSEIVSWALQKHQENVPAPEVVEVFFISIISFHYAYNILVAKNSMDFVFI